MGIVVALLVGRRRYAKIGGDPEEIADVAVFAIPAGIIGGRLYHVITSPDAYFGKGGRPLDSLKIWEGGMGIWGAVALGTLIAYLRFRSGVRSKSFAAFADALAPGVALAQAVGRWGNWFNGELFGKPTRLPWGLEIPSQLRPAGYEKFLTFHPTFLYESLWCLGIALLLIYVKRFQKLAPGNAFLLYVAMYSAGRFWFEALRIDAAHHFFGMRLNNWVSLIVFLTSASVLSRRRVR